MKLLPEPISFEWDTGNIDKNYKKHKVTNQEAEEIFNNEPLIISKDIKHSHEETRYLLWGKTAKEKMLAVIFTIRNKKIRIISARDMNAKERRSYEEKIKINTNI
jgi:uncharacterized DUF497 family protein